MSSKQISLFRPRLWGQKNSQPTWTLNARTASSLVLCVALLSLVGWLYLTQASQIAATEHHMRKVVDEIEGLERENALLRYQIAQLETIPRIEARAKQLGLGPVLKRTTYLAVPEGPWDQETSPDTPAPNANDDWVSITTADSVSTFSPPSLQEIWREVKIQFEAWVGQ